MALGVSVSCKVAFQYLKTLAKINFLKKKKKKWQILVIDQHAVHIKMNLKKYGFEKSQTNKLKNRKIDSVKWHIGFVDFG